VSSRHGAHACVGSPGSSTRAAQPKRYPYRSYALVGLRESLGQPSMHHTGDCTAAPFRPLLSLLFSCDYSVYSSLFHPRFAVPFCSSISPGRLIANPPAPPHRSPDNLPSQSLAAAYSPGNSGPAYIPPASRRPARTSSTTPF
jgi:hypothetical protein